MLISSSSVGDNSLDEAGKIVQLSGMYSDRPEGKNFGYMFNFSFYDNWTGSDNIEAEWDDEGNIVESNGKSIIKSGTTMAPT